ncbi:putative phosphoglycerate mutase [Haloactinopolyspora alba]|uniref:Putative phosphoglycerate mutase n=1 Tax=Haloactinopolyspora alba TaxID=648780 RepID=A0A2P8E7M8_9ACTN|nr:histidine phosphatase family protein [Haloactinopolyspora alba]PSL05475.1 putative phosphoglycerate mutase [Haloactinopolyspora alba]
MTDIVLVRHGETEWHAENRYSGNTDVQLTPRGTAQARELARWARAAGLDAIWSSDLSRSRHTAQPAADATGLDLVVDRRLRELDFGRAEGQTRSELQQLVPGVVEAFVADPVAHHMPGGEHPESAAERGLECLREIAAAHPTGRVLVVGHTTLIRLMVCALLQLPLREYRRLMPFVHNGFLNEIRLRDGRASLLSWNAPPGRPEADVS